MTRKRAIKYLMGVAHFDRNTIQKAFADTHKEVPGSSNVQIAAILLEKLGRCCNRSPQHQFPGGGGCKKIQS